MLGQRALWGQGVRRLQSVWDRKGLRAEGSVDPRGECIRSVEGRTRVSGSQAHLHMSRDRVAAPQMGTGRDGGGVDGCSHWYTGGLQRTGWVCVCTFAQVCEQVGWGHTHQLDVVDRLLLELLERPLGLRLQWEGEPLQGLVLALHADLGLHLGAGRP